MLTRRILCIIALLAGIAATGGAAAGAASADTWTGHHAAAVTVADTWTASPGHQDTWT